MALQICAYLLATAVMPEWAISRPINAAVGRSLSVKFVFQTVKHQQFNVSLRCVTRLHIAQYNFTWHAYMEIVVGCRFSEREMSYIICIVEMFGWGKCPVCSGREMSERKMSGCRNRRYSLSVFVRILLILFSVFVWPFVMDRPYKAIQLQLRSLFLLESGVVLSCYLNGFYLWWLKFINRLTIPLQFGGIISLIW